MWSYRQISKWAGECGEVEGVEGDGVPLIEFESDIVKCGRMGEAEGLVEGGGGGVGEGHARDGGAEVAGAEVVEEGGVEGAGDARAVEVVDDVDGGLGGEAVGVARAPDVGAGEPGEAGRLVGRLGGDFGDEEGVCVACGGVVGAEVVGGDGVLGEVDGGVEDVVVGEVGDGPVVAVFDGADDGGCHGSPSFTADYIAMPS